MLNAFSHFSTYFNLASLPLPAKPQFGLKYSILFTSTSYYCNKILKAKAIWGGESSFGLQMISG